MEIINARVAPSGAIRCDATITKTFTPTKLKTKLNKQSFIPETVSKALATLPMRRFPPAKQKRFTLLMDKNNEGKLSPAEKVEIKKLGAEADEMMLANSRALAMSVRPELFDKRGNLIKKRVRKLT